MSDRYTRNYGAITEDGQKVLNSILESFNMINYLNKNF